MTTVASILHRVKRQFGDEDTAQISDSDIIDWINAACKDLVVKNNLLQKIGTAPTTANTPAYSLPVDCMKLLRVSYQGASLRSMSFQEADELIPSHDASVVSGQYPVGTPTAYWVFAGQINLYPAPSVDGATDLTIYYNKYPTVLADGTGNLELPAEYDNRILEYCLAQAYELDTNYQLSQVKLGQFNQGVNDLKGNSDFEVQDEYPYITAVSDWS